MDPERADLDVAATSQERARLTRFAREDALRSSSLVGPCRRPRGLGLDAEIERPVRGIADGHVEIAAE
jgi:hypothetical protein